MEEVIVGLGIVQEKLLIPLRGLSAECNIPQAEFVV
jgi:hypothetical protein